MKVVSEDGTMCAIDTRKACLKGETLLTSDNKATRSMSQVGRQLEKREHQAVSSYPSVASSAADTGVKKVFWHSKK
jgi:hypothetical protein